MRRITDKHLEDIVERLNNLTGSPLNSYVRKRDGSYTALIGNYHLSYAYGGVSLHRMCGPGGGVTDVLSVGHIPKRELLNLMFAYIKGIEEESI